MKAKKFLKKNAFPLCLIILGCLIFYWTKDYKPVPSGLGPSFFPRLVAVLMMFLSILDIIQNRKMPEKQPNEKAKTGNIQIVETVCALLAMVLLMKYVHPIVGIALFLGFYLFVIAKLDWKQATIITLVGTALLYMIILALRIPM